MLGLREQADRLFRRGQHRLAGQAQGDPGSDKLLLGAVVKAPARD